jgi:hypothetical protein
MGLCPPQAAAVALLVLAVLPAGAASPGAEACKPFDAAEVRRILRIPVGQPKGTGGASMFSCTAQAASMQVTLNHTAEANLALGSEGEFNQSVAGARAAGNVEVQTFKDTRCAVLLPTGGNKYGTFKAWCVLHSRKGRYVSLEVTARNEKQLPKLDKVRTVAEAAAARLP